MEKSKKRFQTKLNRNLGFALLLLITIILYIETIVGADQKTTHSIVPSFPCGYPDPSTIEDLKCWTEGNNTYCIIREIDPLTEVIQRQKIHFGLVF